VSGDEKKPFVRKPPTRQYRGGRPKGSKNKKTLANEQALEKAIEKASNEISAQLVSIVEKMCDKAIKGDTTAAKLILDRVFPNKRSVDERQDSSPVLQINITASEVETNGITIDQEDSAADHAAEQRADGEEPPGSIGPHVVAIHGGAKGEWQE